MQATTDTDPATNTLDVVLAFSLSGEATWVDVETSARGIVIRNGSSWTVPYTLLQGVDLARITLQANRSPGTTRLTLFRLNEDDRERCCALSDAMSFNQPFDRCTHLTFELLSEDGTTLATVGFAWAVANGERSLEINVAGVPPIDERAESAA